MMIARLFVAVLLTIAMTTGAFAVEAYMVAPVENGGSIAGKVAFNGPQPPPQLFEFAKFPQPDFCAKADSDGKGHRARQDVKVKDGGLADVVVFIENIEKGKAFTKTNAEILVDTCRFLVQGGASKSVGVVLNAKKSGVKKPNLKITNTDADPSDPKTAAGILHNPHAYDMKGVISKTLFNKPIPSKGQAVDSEIKPIWFKEDDSFMKVECDQHNYMNAWMLPVENPYYAIVNDDGSFEIGDVPPGKYVVKAFHPSLGFQKQEIEVAAKGKAAAAFTFAGK
jgi:hypothetical protein